MIRKLIITTLCGVLLFGGSRQIQAQPSTAKTETSPAETKFNEGETAKAKGDLEKALQLYQEAFEIDPEYIEPHLGFIMTKRSLASRQTEADRKKGIEYPEPAFQRANREMIAFYKKKIEEKPTIVAYYYAVGRLNDCCELPTAIQFYKKSLELNPKLIRAYDSLADLSWRVANFTENRDYQKKAFEVDTNSAERFYRYAMAEILLDKSKGRKLLRQIADRFPKDEYAVFAMGSEAESYEDEKGRIKVLEEMRSRFAGSKAIGFPYRMSMLYTIYARHDTQKAYNLANEILKQKPEDKEWKTHYEYAKNILEAKRLLQANNHAEAFKLLEKTKPLHFGIDVAELNILKAKAVQDDMKAYKTLIDSLIQFPNVKLEKALNSYGKKLGKSAATVGDDLWQARVGKSKPFKEFDLSVFPLEQKRQISLKSLRNKVVLVNFWFPGCRFCRDEFPYFETMLKKYRARGFEIIGINFVPDEDNQVMIFINQTRSNWIPLKTPGPKWARDNYGVFAAPTNFLLDGEGRIIFQPIIRDDYSARTTERQIELLLDRLTK